MEGPPLWPQAASSSSGPSTRLWTGHARPPLGRPGPRAPLLLHEMGPGGPAGVGSYRLTSQPPAAGGAAALRPRRGRLSGALAGAQRRAQPAFLPHQVPALGSPRPAPLPARAVPAAAARHVLRRCRPPSVTRPHAAQRGSKAPITGAALCAGGRPGPRAPGFGGRGGGSREQPWT